MADELKLATLGPEARPDHLIAEPPEEVRRRFLPGAAELYPGSCACSRNGAHEVRWIGLGPRRRMAARCAGVA